MSATKSSTIEEIQQLILTAAQERFSQFGFNKTTMAEIAKDCKMSASNIYRFFDNKLEITQVGAADGWSRCGSQVIHFPVRQRNK